MYVNMYELIKYGGVMCRKLQTHVDVYIYIYTHDSIQLIYVHGPVSSCGLYTHMQHVHMYISLHRLIIQSKVV